MGYDNLLFTIVSLLIGIEIQVLPQVFQAVMDFLSQLQQQG